MVSILCTQCTKAASCFYTLHLERHTVLCSTVEYGYHRKFLFLKLVSDLQDNLLFASSSSSSFSCPSFCLLHRLHHFPAHLSVCFIVFIIIFLPIFLFASSSSSFSCPSFCLLHCLLHHFPAHLAVCFIVFFIIFLPIFLFGLCYAHTSSNRILKFRAFSASCRPEPFDFVIELPDYTPSLLHLRPVHNPRSLLPFTHTHVNHD